MSTRPAVLGLAALLAACPATHGQQAAPGGAAVHEIRDCTIGMVSKIDLPATEAGVLTYVGVKRGSRVSSEEVLAKIDSREAELTERRARAELALAEHRASQDIQLRFAQASELVERADYEEVLGVRRQVPDAVTNAELRKEELEWRKSQLGAENAEEELKAARIELGVKEAEVALAQVAVERRQVRAPFNGEVLELHREQGEWVQPGDVIAEVAQLDTLQVDGKVYYDDVSPMDIAGCRVTVDVPLGRGRTVEATGWVTYVDPVAEYTGDGPRYRVRAEIANRESQGRWLISPNMNATMRVHLGTADDTQVGDRTPQTRLAK
ncbi:HlyD family efflux transporter periplasmic adaptor subunit [Botrimarina sp.]|uniref:HlyD family secretion protein n=1 Tax=Botrimarina sp. TaxID=2795802 RepID=UPI0032EF2B33